VCVCFSVASLQWRGDITYSTEATTEVLYRLPHQPAQPTHRYYWSKFFFTQATLTSPVARLFFRSQRRFWMLQASWCLGVARRCRAWGLDQAAIDWKNAADQVLRIANVADLYLDSTR